MQFININNDYYIIQSVQSNKNVNLIKKEINMFNDNIIKFIKKANFDNYIIQVKKELLEPDYSLNEKFYKYRNQIISRNYLFYKNKILLDSIDNVNIDMVIKYCKLYINKKNRIIIVVK